MTDLSYVSNCLTKHGIPYTTITKANAGFINDVYLADTCVVKIFKENNGSIARERFIYDTLKPDYAPSLLAQGENYLILQRIKGDSIFHLWPDMNNAQREETVKKVCGILNQLSNADTFENDSIKSCFPWREYIETMIHKRLQNALNCGGIDSVLAERINEYVKQHGEALDFAAASLVYADAHFDNFLFEGEKLYLIDYEMLCLAPYDYTLDVFMRMSIHPHVYANEEDDPRQHKEDYIQLINWVKKYAPNMFDVPKLENRLALYGIAYELDSLSEYPKAKLPKERLLLNLEQ